MDSVFANTAENLKTILEFIGMALLVHKKCCPPPFVLVYVNRLESLVAYVKKQL